jgi:hypothetical protein
MWVAREQFGVGQGFYRGAGSVAPYPLDALGAPHERAVKHTRTIEIFRRPGGALLIFEREFPRRAGVRIMVGE